MINYEEETRKIITVYVPHELFDLFTYGEAETGSVQNTHYSTFHLNEVLEDIDDYELEDDEVDIFKDYYDFANARFKEGNCIIEFVDEDYE